MLVLSPWLCWRAYRTGRYRRHLAAKLFGQFVPKTGTPSVWFHGVSVGEIHLLRGVIAAFKKRYPHWSIIVSATTDTGLEEAHKMFAECTVIPYPFDFTWAVRRTMRAIQPHMIVLAESELWPNFLAIAQREHVPVLVINGRMSPRTAGRFQRMAGLARRVLFDRVTLFAMQSETYARHLRLIGVPAERVRVTGNVKYDGASGDRNNPSTLALRQQLSLRDNELVWLAGSTHAPEEQIVLNIYRRLHERYPVLRLIIVPRAKDRFDEVAQLIQAMNLPFVRYSQIASANLPPRAVVLIDTMGVLGAAWGLADLGFTGGSLNDQRGGQSMIEPAAYGVPVLFGPHTWNFKDAVAGLLDLGGAIRVHNEAELEQGVVRLLDSSELRSQMGSAAQAFVAAQQGATGRTLALFDEVAHQGTNT